MIQLLRTFFKLFVIQFYKLNGGFFLFWFIFFFGIISPGQLLSYHLALIQVEIGSYTVLAGIMFAWLLYNEKCLECFKKIILTYQNSFLHVIQGIDVKKIILIFVICHATVFLPVSIYASIVAVIAISEKDFSVAILILVFLILVAILSIARIKRLLFQRISSDSYSFFNKLLNNSTKPLNINFYLTRYVLSEKKLNYFILKIVSLFLFYLFLIRLKSDFSKAWFVVILLIISLGHSTLAFHIHKFKEERLIFIRNLPLSTFQKIIMFFVVYCLLFIPELLFMLINGLSMLSITEIITYYLVLIIQLMFFTSILYIKNLQLKQYIRILVIVLLPAAYLFMVLDYRFLLLFQLGASYIIFKKRYFSYEHIVHTN